MTSRWQIEETVHPTQGDQSLRALLERSWLLPHRFVHYLRVREHVLLNGRYQPMNTAVTVGDRIDLFFDGDEFRTAESSYRPDPRVIPPVGFENRDLLVINKPAGLKAHPNQAGEGGTVLNGVAAYLQDQPQAAAYMVHRLDQATSGAMIVAKNPVVVPILDRQLSAGDLHRTYLALVAGHFAQPRGHFTWPIGRDPQDKRKRQVNGLKAQPAWTDYRVVGESGGQSLVELDLKTGRTHQLRVHLAFSGHPIVGDPLYNPQPAPRMMLHAATQRLRLPFSNQFQQIEVAPPTTFPANLVNL